MTHLPTWRRLISIALTENQDTTRLVHCTLTDEELDTEFNAGYGTEEGKPFTLWTETHVYFPICYDGAEWVGSAPRNPCDVALEHQGGG